MKFFMSSESDGRYVNFEDSLRRVRNDIEKRIKDFVKDKDYGNDVKDISIIPAIIKFDQHIPDTMFKERVLYKKKIKDADLRLRIDYDKFIKGDDEVKKLLIIVNIIKSIDALSKKVKDFRYQELQKDILNLFGLTFDDIRNI